MGREGAEGREQMGHWTAYPTSEVEQLRFTVLLHICFLYLVLFEERVSELENS